MELTKFDKLLKMMDKHKIEYKCDVDQGTGFRHLKIGPTSYHESSDRLSKEVINPETGELILINKNISIMVIIDDVIKLLRYSGVYYTHSEFMEILSE